MTDAALHQPLDPPRGPRSAKPAWFDHEAPALMGLTCTTCGTVTFPPVADFCENPSCAGESFDRRALSTSGTVWSWTTNHYRPPAPAVSADPFVPYTVAAVRLEAEGMIVLGQLSTSSGPVAVGDHVALVAEPLLEDEAGTQLVWRWTLADPTPRGQESEDR